MVDAVAWFLNVKLVFYLVKCDGEIGKEQKGERKRNKSWKKKCEVERNVEKTLSLR